MSQHDGGRLRRRIGAILQAAVGPADAPAKDDLASQARLERRVAHLEALVEGLQDAVHRDALRHDKRITEVERRTQPEELAKALSADARRRGL